jgi:hypothetical protein
LRNASIRGRARTIARLDPLDDALNLVGEIARQ